jgi:hypothetical protein
MFLHAIGFGIVPAAVMALAAAMVDARLRREPPRHDARRPGVGRQSLATLPYGDLVRRG